MNDRLADLRLSEALRDTASAVESILETELPEPIGASALLYEAMRYSVLNGGKRLRAFLVRAGAQLAGADDGRALLAGSAVELIHAYSLVHDDLPALDNDDLRRGAASCHVAFDEATAILTGDALLTLAFELAVDSRMHPDPSVRCELVNAMAVAAGCRGMAGGQMMDLAAEHSDVNLEFIAMLDRMKTGALIAFSCEAGAILAGREADVRSSLREYGFDIGLAFQVIDDLLDVVGDEVDFGKRVSKDAAAGKATFLSVLGVDGAKREAAALVDRAFAHLERFDKRAQPLRAFGEYVLNRRK